MLDYLEMNQDDDSIKKSKPKIPYIWGFLQSKHKGSVKGACL